MRWEKSHCNIDKLWLAMVLFLARELGLKGDDQDGVSRPIYITSHVDNKVRLEFDNRCSKIHQRYWKLSITCAVGFWHSCCIWLCDRHHPICRQSAASCHDCSIPMYLAFEDPIKVYVRGCQLSTMVWYWSLEFRFFYRQVEDEKKFGFELVWVVGNRK